MTHRPPRAVRALAAGVCVGLSLPPWGWWPLAVVGIAWLHRLADPLAARGRAAAGWWFAAGWLGLGMVWMWFLSVPGYVAAVAVFAGLHAAAEAVVARTTWSVVVRPATHTVAEAVRFCFPFGGVPLASLGITAAATPLIWIGRVGGVLLITWTVLQLCCVVGDVSGRVWARRGDTPAVRPPAALGLAAAACVIVIALGFAAPDGRTWDLGGLRLAVVQGGGPQGTRAIHSDPQVVLDRHLAGTRTIRRGEVDAVLWPENIIDVATFAGSPQLATVVAEARRLDVPMIVSITEDAPGDRFSNAQVVVTPDGRVISRYDKVRRVPFGEFMPLRGLLHALGAPTDLVPRDAVAGTTPAVLRLPGATRLGVAISWEVFFGGRVNEGVAHGGQAVVNPTNGSSYTWTVLQTQQVASSRLRAVEQGRWVIQAAPTGFSAFVDPAGGVHQRTTIGAAAVIRATVELYAGRTWYSRWGNLPFVGLPLAVAVCGLAGPAIRRRRRCAAGGTVTVGSGQVEQHGDRAVVDQLDRHLGAEPAGGDPGAQGA